MSGSNLTPFNFIPENSLATPGLWNSVFSTLSQNIAEANTIGSVQSGGISLGTQGLTINVPSNATDYIFLNDSANLRSSYVIGSFNSGTADGLNIWDASGQTMIVSFSKQSIRFYQQVVGPVFDVGGALADTLNAATFGTGTDSDESRIQAAISAASLAGISRVYVPANMYPFSGASVSFDTRVQMVREGGDWTVCDVLAYGARGTLATDSTAAIQSALSSAHSLQKPCFVPAGSYAITGLRYFPGTVLRGAGGSIGGANSISQLYQGSANTTILRPHDPTVISSGFRIEDLTLGASGNVNNQGLLDCTNANTFRLNRVTFSSGSQFLCRVVGGPTAGNAGFGLLNDCVFTNTQAGGTDLLLVSTANDQPDGMVLLGCYFSSNETWLGSLATVGGGTTSCLIIGNRFEASGKTVSAISGRIGSWQVVGNRFETTASGGTLYVSLRTNALGSTNPCATFIANSWAAPSGISWLDEGNPRSPRWGDTETGGLQRNEVQDGTAVNPTMSFGSEHSLGWYRSAASTMALSYGTLRVPGPNFLRMPTGGTGDGRLMTRSSNVLGLSVNVNSSSAQDSFAGASWLLELYGGAGDTNDQVLLVHARPNGGLGTVWSWDSAGNSSMTSGTGIVPALNFLSERSLGLYKSAKSTLALSYGTFDLTAGGAVTSIASLKIKSGANNSCGTAVLGSNGSVNVANTYVAAGDLIFLTDQTPGGTLGDLELGGIRAGSGFTIQSTSITDTSTVGWLIVRPT